jgi:ribose-phosphate pyrophosphokinase
MIGYTGRMSRPPRLLFTIASYAYLEQAMIEAGGFERGTVERRTFPDGERYMRLVDSPLGREVVLLGGTPTDLDWMELYDLACAIAHAGARALAIAMPYFGHATMERAVKPGEVVTAKNRARLLSTVPRCGRGTSVVLFDLHTDGLEFYFGDNMLTRHVYGAPIVSRAANELMGDRPYVLGATDAGRAKWVQSLARTLGVEPAFVYKQRDGTSGSTSVTGINADVRGREVVIYDDMIRTGSSLVQAARAYIAAGATRVHALASHLVLPGDSLAKIMATGVLASVSGTDSHPGSRVLATGAGAAGRVYSVAPLLVDALEYA